MVGTLWLSINGATTPCKAGFPVTLVWMVRRFGDASVLNRRLLEIGSCGLVFGSEVFALEFYPRIFILGILFQSGFQPSSFRWLVALFELKVSGHKLPVEKSQENQSGFRTNCVFDQYQCVLHVPISLACIGLEKFGFENNDPLPLRFIRSRPCSRID